MFSAKAKKGFAMTRAFTKRALVRWIESEFKAGDRGDGGGGCVRGCTAGDTGK